MKLVYFVFLTIISSLSIDLTSKQSICNAARYIQLGEWNYYEGLKYGGTVGMFSPPNYWWNSAEAFGGLINYYSYCEQSNSTLLKLISEGMIHQAGENGDYMPQNQTTVEGNDDLGQWGIALLEAIDHSFPDPANNSWYGLTLNIYQQLLSKWDSSQCGGGLRWQMYDWKRGYDYKNTITNGLLFHLAARLGRYASLEEQSSYVLTANNVWNWMQNIGLIEYEWSNTTLCYQINIYDGGHVDDDCVAKDTNKWSYNYGVLMAGCANMYILTGDIKWLTRTTDIWTASKALFFNQDKIMQETTCKAQNNCNNDERSFRSLFSRHMKETILTIPGLKDDMKPYMQSSAAAAAQSCSGGSDGITCGFDWSQQGWDGVYGLGEQMSALETVLLATAYN